MLPSLKILYKIYIKILRNNSGLAVLCRHSAVGSSAFFCFRNYIKFSGRASRGRTFYSWCHLFQKFHIIFGVFRNFILEISENFDLFSKKIKNTFKNKVEFWILFISDRIMSNLTWVMSKKALVVDHDAAVVEG